MRYFFLVIKNAPHFRFFLGMAPQVRGNREEKINDFYFLGAWGEIPNTQPCKDYSVL
jgi:hypothetical protein